MDALWNTRWAAAAKPAPDSFVVGYKMFGPAWCRYCLGVPTLDEAVREAEELIAQKREWIYRVSVFPLAIWNYYKPTAEPVWDWWKNGKG